MVDLLTSRTGGSLPLTWVGRAVPGRDFLKELPRLVAAVAHGDFDLRARAVPLADIEQAWTATGSSVRIVMVA